jgi:5,6,7,8-tetrahydromethanopterin hydro-lyase
LTLRADEFRRYLANRSGSAAPDAVNKDRRCAECRGLRPAVFFGQEMAMAKINGLCVGESLVGDGNEVAHIDLILGPRGSAAETAFANALTNNQEGFTHLLALVAPNLMCKPPTVMFNKVTIKGAKQAVQMFGPAQHAVAKAVADSVAEGVIPQDEAENLFVCVGVFIHWDAADDAKIQDFNYRATKEALARAVAGEPRVHEVVARRDQVKHPFAA